MKRLAKRDLGMNATYILATVFVAILSGCGGGGSGNSSDSSSNLTATSASIVSYNVNGTPGLSLPGVPERISPYENDGVFTVTYEIDANGTVDIELSVIHTDDSIVFCGNESTEFFDKDCGEGKSCALAGEISCKFEPNNLISCEGGKKTDLTPFFDSIPQEADMVLCVTRRNGGTAQKERVEFQ